MNGWKTDDYFLAFLFTCIVHHTNKSPAQASTDITIWRYQSRFHRLSVNALLLPFVTSSFFSFWVRGHCWQFCLLLQLSLPLYSSTHARSWTHGGRGGFVQGFVKILLEVLPSEPLFIFYHVPSRHLRKRWNAKMGQVDFKRRLRAYDEVFSLGFLDWEKQLRRTATWFCC